jgi:hypothetical protein
MEHEHHAAEDIDKDETVPRIIAIVAGVALIGIVAGGLMYSGIWSPSPTQVSAAKH